jgi:hypothetical protein
VAEISNTGNANTGLSSTEPVIHLSVDALKKWSRCKKQFYYDVAKKLRWPSDKRNFQLGQDVHKLMDYAAKNLPTDLLEPAMTPAVTTSWKALQAHPLAAAPVLASEWGFSLPFENSTVWLEGRVDRIAWDTDNQKLLVLDWKTGTSIPKDADNDWQTRVYCYATVLLASTFTASIRNLPDTLSVQLSKEAWKPEAVEFRYVEVRNGATRVVSVPYNSEKHQQTHMELTKVIRAIRQERRYALPVACPDRYCAYRAICGIDDISPLQKKLSTG